jgi:hypothetical protein
MCDMNQLVLVTYVQSTLICDLTPTFMQEMLLEVGCCVVVVIDKGSNFNRDFQEMCRILKITLHVIARANHQGLAIEQSHRFLNTSITRSTKYMQHTNTSVVIPANHLTIYA